MKHTVKLVAALGLLALGNTSGWAIEADSALVDSTWLAAHLNEVVVIDVRADLEGFTAAAEYATDEQGQRVLDVVGGHIPGARPLDYAKLRSSRQIDDHTIDKLLPDAAGVEALLQPLGVNADDFLVITAPGESYEDIDMAARLYWTLKSYGHRRLALLDGGNAAWGQAGQPLPNDAAAMPERGNWQAGRLDRSWLADTGSVQASEGMTLIDARPAAQFHGLSYKKPSIKAPGHIANAHNWPPELRSEFDGLSEQLLDAQRAGRVLRTLGIDTDQGAIVYCNTGQMAAGAWFLLSEVLGRPDVRLYDGSMHEWTTRGLPTVALQP